MKLSSTETRTHHISELDDYANTLTSRGCKIICPLGNPDSRTKYIAYNTYRIGEIRTKDDKFTIVLDLFDFYLDATLHDEDLYISMYGESVSSISHLNKILDTISIAYKKSLLDKKLDNLEKDFN